MQLPKEDAEKVIQLMLRLLAFTNEKLNICPGARAKGPSAEFSLNERIRIRDAMWKDRKILNAFLSENPYGLDANDLDIVRKWRERAVVDEFYIYRYLKNHAIFIADEKVYGVLALVYPFETIFPEPVLPVLVGTVLLPFCGRIAWDGLAESYNVRFGSGVRSDLREIYLAAKENLRVITTLEGEGAEGEDARRELEKRQEKTRQDKLNKLLSIEATLDTMQGESPMEKQAFRLLRECSGLAKAIVEHPFGGDELWTSGRKTWLALERFRKMLERSEKAGR
ncbi:MAG: hypothetical protein N3A38_04415 [Planctomycetota bacterium]|nr:hypothetical protein [Planctomycetota bacterium]